MSASNIQVAIKVRPILGNETEQKQSSFWRVSGNSIQLIEGQQEPFYFDHIFDQDVNNQVIFDTMAKQIVDSGIKGFNGTIFAYGQTSSGKTYTMMGEKTNPGVMELATKEIFKEIEKASDRQFLLRVGYIEIYNEKIYDLLNKSNQDLKIHETPNGDVSVNCSEYIITSEEHLLSYLRMGTKQRKSGETNMNERSSRSHAIFRIIIESRKTDNTDDESVQISILNLVDLAGSERADQTGATGSRLKEGSHINKSLLFLSCVIKQLAEDKYVSYRDSKLTRILQASLGGNALTAIICTVNSTAVDETLSTLSFANRAKVVKNKPQLNEVMTDAAMMKRLEKEINRLQSELELEKSKNSQIKVSQLQKRLNEEILKIINSNSSNSSKAATDKRRRTWCPSSHTPPIIDLNSDTTYLPQPTVASQMPTKLQLPKSVMNFTPHITLRDVYYQDQLKDIIYSPSIDEEFMPAEEACFDEALTPRTSPSHHLNVGFQTPKQNQNLRTASLTPRLTEKESLQKVERELKELEAFTNLENKLNVEHDTYNSLKYKLENAERVIARYEKEREDFAFIKVEYVEAEVNLSNCQKRCQQLESNVRDLESQITGLESQASVIEKAAQDSADRAVRYEKEVTELKAKIAHLEMESREAVSLEFEFQQHKNKSKRRENELLDALEEKQKEIKRLEQSLQTVTNEVLNNSKEELRQISQGHDEAETVCVKCKDLQQLLTENKQLAQDFEKSNLDYQALQLILEKASSEAESEKLRADTLEAENDGLKKDAEHLKSLHGTLEEIQHQIAALQAEKCKLESVKIEFEVMSKETANKIAEKINISQEIETLNTQRDTLAAECDKLLAVIAANGSVIEELNQLRTDNSLLHSELQTIKTKLETAQADYANLKTENQSKSDNFEKLNMEVLSARNQLMALQGEYHDIQQKYEQIQAECNKHEGTIGEIQSEYELIRKKYQNLQREYEKLENDSVQSIADCDRVQNQNENLETEIRELKAKVEEAQRKLLENDSLQLELESLKSEMNRLQGEYEKNVALQRKSASPSKQENGLDPRQESAQLKNDLANLQVQFNEMQKEYDDISTQLVDTFGDYETLQSEMAKVEAELKKYKDSVDEDHVKALKAKNEQLEAENSHLAQENADWAKTVSSLTNSIRDKCDEREQLVVQLEEVKNQSARSESPRKSVASCEQFLQLADSFIEIEISAANGRIKTFQAAGTSRSTTGSRMVIGSINGITQGSFNELRGTIEFAVEQKSGNEIYDSLEVEDNLTSANSCDSLEGVGRQPNESQINDLLEEKSQLFEKIRDMEEAITTLKIQNEQLASAGIELGQLNAEKTHLTTICDENKCQINELNAIIFRAECENKKLIADCEQLKKTVESECVVESVSRAIYEELKRQNEEMCEKLDKLEEYEEKCAELREQLLTLQSKLGDEENMKEFNSEHEGKCADYRSEISKLEAIVNVMSKQLEIKNDLPARAELEETIAQLHEHLQACKCVELQASLAEKTQQLADVRDDKTAKYEQDICLLLEKLKQQECKCQEVQIEIIELKTSLEEKIQESAESAAKFEELSGRNAKLQAECDELQRQNVAEKKKTADFEKTFMSLEKMEDECNLLQNSVACLSQTVESLGKERNAILEQKEMLSEKLLCVEQESESLRNASEKLKFLEGKHTVVFEENKAVIEECQILKNSERSLHEQLQKLIQDHELNVRDKERLERECHQTSSEMEKLRDEYESNLKDKRDVQQRCEQMKEELNKASAEKKRLESELSMTKEQHENLKESHKEERSLLEVKCSSLASEMEALTTTKNELQSALEKAQLHSEFLLQQGKDLEEQFNLELCTVRNSNNSMAQQIDDLYEKLDRAEIDLKLAKECSDKNELIIQLTSDNNALSTRSSELERMLEEANNQKRDNDELIEQLSAKSSEFEEKVVVLNQQLMESNHLKQEKEELIAQMSTKSFELEDNITLLKQELAESKQCMSHEEHLRAENDKLMAQLTTGSSELEKEFALLQKELEESKRCLSTEVHLKEVLEKANAERDDLIVQLTNNNNSLATKSTELEEKLAILGNQFEESKRHLSTEIVRLQQLLAETSQVSTTQSSQIKDLTSKIQTLEDDLKTTQSAATERDSLLQKLDQFQAEYETLACQHTNLQQRRSSFEAELNSARDVVVENTTLTQKVTELQSALQEVQLQCRSLSSNNERLESANKTLSKELNEVKQKAGECRNLKDEIAKFQGQLEKVQKEASTTKEQQKRSCSEYQSKELSFMEQISQLQGNVTSLISEKITIQEKLENSEKLSFSRIAQLEQQIQLLQKEHSMNLSKSISPKREKAIDHLLGENHQLKVKNRNLMDKLDSCQKSQNEERKNRRLSTHDERRRQSFWDSNRDVSTMTDPTNSECSCSELDLKLNELRQRLLIRDSQVNTLSMELKNHPLKMENATLKKLLNDEESKKQKLRQEIKKCQQLIVSRTNENRLCAKCAEVSKRIIVDSSTQTADRDETECYRKLLSKYEDLKMICRVRHTRIKELEDALSTGKENAVDNTPSHQEYRKKYEHLKKELKVIQEKYWEAKTLCNLRYEQIKDLNTKLSQKS